MLNEEKKSNYDMKHEVLQINKAMRHLKEEDMEGLNNTISILNQTISHQENSEQEHNKDQASAPATIISSSANHQNTIIPTSLRTLSSSVRTIPAANRSSEVSANSGNDDVLSLFDSGGRETTWMSAMVYSCINE